MISEDDNNMFKVIIKGFIKFFVEVIVISFIILGIGIEFFNLPPTTSNNNEVISRVSSNKRSEIKEDKAIDKVTKEGYYDRICGYYVSLRYQSGYLGDGRYLISGVPAGASIVDIKFTNDEIFKDWERYEGRKMCIRGYAVKDFVIYKITNPEIVY